MYNTAWLVMRKDDGKYIKLLYLLLPRYFILKYTSAKVKQVLFILKHVGELHMIAIIGYYTRR
jgi:hypothetical protein